MSDGHEIDLEAIDRDGAIREAREGLTRGELLSGGVLAAVAGLALPGRAHALSQRDASILNYALTLEYLQAAFYSQADRVGALTGRAAQITRTLGGVERAHVAAFKDLLGRRAIRRPSFDFRGTTEEDDAFVRTAVAFEDLSVEAYKAQAPRIQDDEILVAAVGIHSVEARHAAWMRRLLGVQPAARAFDRARGQEGVLELVAETEFVVRQRPRTTRRRRSSRFTG